MDLNYIMDCGKILHHFLDYGILHYFHLIPYPTPQALQRERDLQRLEAESLSRRLQRKAQEVQHKPKA